MRIENYFSFFIFYFSNTETMRFLGFILIITGLILTIYIIFSWWQDRNALVSPIPDNKGVKVIFLTPSE